jgi:hypothetical protein
VSVHRREIASELVYGADFRCVLHRFLNLTRRDGPGSAKI